MQKINRSKFLTVVLLSSLSVILLAGIFINELVFNASAPVSSNVDVAPSLLPSLSSESRWGTSYDDEYVDSFPLGSDVYLFFNEEKGKIVQNGSNNTSIEVEGLIKKVALTPWGFAIALSRDGEYAIQLFDFTLAPVISRSLSFNEIDLQYLTFEDDTLRVGIRHKGTYDYIFTYVKLNSTLETVYERMIYSVYDISLVDCFELSNKSILFFNAQYGSVYKSGVSTIYPQSLAVDTSYFSFGNHSLLDVIPTNSGFNLLCVDGENQGFLASIDLEGNTNKDITLVSNVVGGKFYGDGLNTYRIFEHDNGTCSVYEINNGMTLEYFNDCKKVLDCIFVDGSALFAVVKNNKTFLYHIATGVSCLILDKAIDNLVLKKSDKVHFFTSVVIENTTVTTLGGKDIYCGILQ